MKHLDQKMYMAFSSVVESVRKFCLEKSIKEIMPSPVAPSFEFPPNRSLFIGDENSPELILPASNSFQKQVAAQYLGRVFCFAPSYRREQAWVEGSLLHLQVFHQIEVEILNIEINSAMEIASSLLEFIIADFPVTILKADKKIFSQIDKIDLAQIDESLHYINAYEKWASDISMKNINPLWVIHTPQTPLPRLNNDYDDKLSMGFDMILPKGFGELMSGGERDIRQLAKFFRKKYVFDKNHKSCGFGIGLERLIAFLLQIPNIRKIILPHHK
jgi:asparaginyl-tRNA synthetase